MLEMLASHSSASEQSAVAALVIWELVGPDLTVALSLMCPHATMDNDRSANPATVAPTKNEERMVFFTVTS